MTRTPGSRIGRYEITAALGAGGMGDVFLAQDTRLNRRVALKLLRDAVDRDRSVKPLPNFDEDTSPPEGGPSLNGAGRGRSSREA
jgi:serine/threonine protein kinase